MEEFNHQLEENFQKLLDFPMNDSIMKQLTESEIDLLVLIDLDDYELNEFGISLGKNNLRNDLHEINCIVKEVQNGTGLDNLVIEKLLENNIRFDQFLKFDKNKLNDCGFKLGTSIKIAQKLKNILSIREEENKKIELEKNFFELKKLLGSKSRENDLFEEDFNRIILEELNQECLKSLLSNKKSFSVQLKPFLMDNLKRIKRFNSIISKINEIAYEATNNEDKDDEMTKKLLSLITEKDLVICLLESIGSRSLGRLGYLLAKNDYPLPIFYQYYENKNNCLEEKVNFEILSDLLCLTNKFLAIVSGTSSTIRKRQSMLIPFMFSGLNMNSVYEIRANTPLQNSVDIICNDELNESWIIANFSGSINGKNMIDLFKSFSAFASIHVLNVNINDFDEQTGEPKYEIMDVLNSFNRFKSFFSYDLKLIVLIHDNFKNNLNSLKMIREKIANYYSHSSILTVDNLFDSTVDTEILKIKKNLFIKEFQKCLKDCKYQKFQSIIDVKLFFENLKTDSQYCSNKRQETWVEREFRKLFCAKGDKTDSKLISEMFELSNIYKKIEINENSLNYSDLKQQLKVIKPKNKILDFFIKILECDENFLQDLSIFEKCLINFKKDELKNLREERNITSDKISIMENKIKSKQQVNQEDYSNLKKFFFQIDEKIKIMDLTLDKFWDELFLYVDWLDETKNSNETLKTKIIDRFLKLIRNGHSIHLLRGSPLSVKSNLLKDIMGRLDNYRNIHVLSVIGEQSSAKSSLLNSLFGCDFRTSAGRCTVGIYMNFVTCGDKTIVILDTEGLASIESNNKLFDNQMATMSVFSSHLILINHKGEISSNLENILGITYFAKINLTNYSFKPSVFFVLRDQLDRSESSINNQVCKLKERLKKQSEFIRTDLDNVIDIGSNHLTLLPSAFSEIVCPTLNNTIKCRNSLFPDQVLTLRKNLINHMNSIDKADVIESLSVLYTRLNSNWYTISKTGKNIFNCKDLEELKIRDEIAAISHDLFTKHRDSLVKQIDQKLTKIIEDFKNNQNFDIQAENKCKEGVIKLINETKYIFNSKFDSQTNLPFYPISIKEECKNVISYQFKWIENISVHRLNENGIYLKNLDEFNNFNKNVVKQINHLLNANVQYQSEEALLNDVKKRLDVKQSENFNRLKSMVKPLEKIIQDIEALFDNTIRLFKSKNPKLNGVENCLHLNDYYTSNLSENPIIIDIKVENWLPNYKEITQKIKNFPKNKAEIKKSLKFWCEKLIIRFDQTYLIDSNSFHVTQSFIGDILNFLNDILSDQYSIVNEYNLNFGRVFNSLIKHFLFLIVKKQDHIQNQNIKREEDKYEKEKNELIEKTKATFRLKSNCKKLGSKIANDFIDKLFDDLIQIEHLSIINKCKEKINEKFKTPNELIEFAFKLSFEDCNYERVFKYVIDVNRYCKEVCLESINNDLKILVNRRQECIKNLYTQFFLFLKNVNLDSEILSCSQFFENLKIEAEKVNESLVSFFNLKDLIIGTEIKDKDLFVLGFKESIGNFYEKIEQKIDRFNKDLDTKCKDEIKEYIDVYLGCCSRCPCCGSKCENAKGHDGNHVSSFHILDSFFKWGEKKTNNVTTFFCWEEKKFKKVQIYRGEKKFDNCTIFLQTEHPDWLNDITENYNKYGKNPLNLENKKFSNQIIRAWMNTRKPLLKLYQRLEKEYDSEWMLMEDENKMLKEDHIAEWNEHF
ncbi:Interferon-induced very large GTPase 1 [Brachionus plicatilis]|uniref:Interferon-induced very large GTPase 1 n=1 Tax=Brachionus plicatilis TaxID=10195 RepID=A0A3M7PHA5_BRAPC|nr:Interferon-induced very large GTPase 1 [Brachionus plicatilis]